ncbi:MAG: helix-turn-helix transcriptional regulator [Solobacterium sp.]|nr:helix-turn-helix transcriptional regulator [Solobacterium sp.]
MDIGSMLKTARSEAGMTQEKAAEALGVSRQTISNWETGKTYPDIFSVIRMSDLYSVSLDHLLKEETSMKESYAEYLKQSTDTVASKDRLSKIILVCAVFGIWAVSVMLFWLVKNGTDPVGYTMMITWTVLPVMFFGASYIIGVRDYFGRWKWLSALVFSLMYTVSGSITSIMVDNILYRSVIWPDFTKLPIGLFISLAGLAAGCFVRYRRTQQERSE